MNKKNKVTFVHIFDFASLSFVLYCRPIIISLLPLCGEIKITNTTITVTVMLFYCYKKAGTACLPSAQKCSITSCICSACVQNSITISLGLFIP